MTKQHVKNSLRISVGKAPSQFQTWFLYVFLQWSLGSVAKNLFHPEGPDSFSAFSPWPVNTKQCSASTDGACALSSKGAGLSVPLPVGMSDPGPLICSTRVCMGVQPHHGSLDGLKWGRAWAVSVQIWGPCAVSQAPSVTLDARFSPFLNLFLRKQWWWFSRVGLLWLHGR